MSYILDALRRADAERERGRVPGLHTQLPPSRAADGAGRSGAPRPPWRRWGVAAIGLMALVGAGVWWTRGDAPAEGGVAPAPAPATPPVAAAPPPAAAEPRPTEPGAPRAAAPVQPILAPAPPPPATPPAPRPPANGTAAASSPNPGPAAAPPVAAAPAAKATGPADDALPRVADLAPPARSALPTLQVSGATYASNPALRMLIVDGKVLQEGQDIAPGLKLETIGPRAAVINHQGQRLRLTY